jgi:hypothetical protein
MPASKRKPLMLRIISASIKPTSQPANQPTGVLQIPTVNQRLHQRAHQLGVRQHSCGLSDQHVGGFFGIACGKRIATLSRLNKGSGTLGIVRQPTCICTKERGVLVRHPEIGISKRPLRAARQDGVDAFPGADFKGKVDRPVGQRLISGRAQNYRIRAPLPCPPKVRLPTTAAFC